VLSCTRIVRPRVRTGDFDRHAFCFLTEHEVMSLAPHRAPRTAAPGELSPSLVVDRVLSDNVRVRRWQRTSPLPIAGRPGAHDGVEIAWVVGGHVHYRVGSAAFDLAPGDVMVVPRDVEHTTTFLTDVTAGATWLARDFVDQVLDACGTRASDLKPTMATGAARIARLGRELEEDASLPGAGQLLAVESIAEAMVARLAGAVLTTRGPGEKALDRRIRAALDLMETQYSEPLAVDAMAKAASMSRFHFSRAFREATGRAPYAYLKELRVTRAAELLRAGHHSVTEAAFAVGFTDLGRFARAFRERHGRTPSEVARDARRTT